MLGFILMKHITVTCYHIRMTHFQGHVFRGQGHTFPNNALSGGGILIDGLPL